MMVYNRFRTSHPFSFSLFHVILSSVNEESKPRDLSRLRIAESDRSRAPTGGALNNRMIVIAACGGLVVLYWLLRPAPVTAPSTISAQSTAAAPMYVPDAHVLNASGYVIAQQKAAVSSKATGRLKELRVAEGDKVKKGDVLGVLENDDLKAIVAEKEAAVGAMQANNSFAEAELSDARKNLTRMSRMEQAKASSKSELDAAQARFQKAEASLAASKANLEMGRAQLEKVKVDLNYTFIVAPFDGTVLTKNADVGEVVAPFGSSADARAAIVTIADMSSLQVEADVSEANMQKVFVGQECEIVLDSFPEKTYHGFVDKIVPTVDRSKATVLTKIRFVDRDDAVIPEMSAKISFKIGK